MSADVFISYSSHDRAVALGFHDRLCMEGISVWIDRSGIDGAQQWSQAIVEAADEARVMLLLVSRVSVASTNVVKEVSLFAEKRKAILPMRLEEAVLTPALRYHLSGVQHLDWDPSDEETSYKTVFRALRRLGVSVPDKAAEVGGTTPAHHPGHVLMGSPRERRKWSWRSIGMMVVLLLLGVLGIEVWLYPAAEKRDNQGVEVGGSSSRSHEGLRSRPILRPASMLRAMRDELRKKPEPERRTQRFLTLRSLHNHPEVTADQLQQFQEELNRLTGKNTQAVLHQLDRDRTVFVLDLDDWSEEPEWFWSSLTQRYPYALQYSECQEPEIRDLAREVEILSGTDLCHVRADWFVAAVAQLRSENRELFVESIAVRCRILLRHYEKPIGPAEAASELGLKSAAELGNLLRATPESSRSRLRLLGLWPMADGESVSRAIWGSTAGAISPFQHLAVELDTGCPVRPPASPYPEVPHGRSLKVEREQLAASLGGFFRELEQKTIVLENWQGPHGLPATGWPRLVYLLERGPEGAGSLLPGEGPVLPARAIFSIGPAGERSSGGSSVGTGGRFNHRPSRCLLGPGCRGA